MSRTAVFVLLAAALLPCLAQPMISSHEVPLVTGTYGRFAQNNAMFQWWPFDSTRTHWNMTQYPTGLWTRVGLRPYTEGRSPAPDSMDDDPPAPDVCEMDTLGSGTPQWSYMYKNQFGLYFDGIDFSQGGYRFLGNYRPDGYVYSTPMYYGAGWLSAIQWAYEIIPGIPYTATEQHVKKIVSKGKVKVPMSGDYYWPCLVIRDQMTFSDNMGSDDRRWIYEWVVAGHFLGGNGVAAAMSQNGAANNFINVEQLFQMSSATIPGWDLIPPTFIGARIWPDTSYAGPYVLWVNISDDGGVAAESVFYRVNGGAWQACGPDSSAGPRYCFTIPQVTMPAQVDYYYWAKDSFSTRDSIDCWTTWPVCSPESTFLRFNASGVAVREGPQLQPGDEQLLVTPNPFGHRTRFVLARYGTTEARVDIYSVNGELVRSLDLVASGAGLEAAWDGTTTTGDRLPPGTYLYTVTSGDWSRSGKLLFTQREE